MRTFVCLMAFLGIVFYLVANFSFWTVFGALYAAGLLLVSGIAFMGKRGVGVQSSLCEMKEVDQNR